MIGALCVPSWSRPGSSRPGDEVPRSCRRYRVLSAVLAQHLDTPRQLHHIYAPVSGSEHAKRVVLAISSQVENRLRGRLFRCLVLVQPLRGISPRCMWRR